MDLVRYTNIKFGVFIKVSMYTTGKDKGKDIDLTTQKRRDSQDEREVMTVYMCVCEGT